MVSAWKLVMFSAGVVLVAALVWTYLARRPRHGHIVGYDPALDNLRQAMTARQPALRSTGTSSNALTGPNTVHVVGHAPVPGLGLVGADLADTKR